MEQYIKGPTLGEGTFGSVFKATHKETGRVVAIKKIRVGNKSEGINVTALREIKLLRELKSPYIIELIDVFPKKDKLSLVFEFMESDLEAVIKDRSLVLGAADVKSYMHMILKAIAFCHNNWVLHRDVKPNNMLLGSTGELKLADFGLARVYGSPGRQYTNQVFARWYRAPELLFGSTMYTSAVDMWAVGCVFAELLLRRPWFPGITDIDQLGRIFQALGTPTPEQWAGLKDLPTFIEFNPTPKPPLRTLFAGCPAGDDALELLSAMMQFDPNRRISAEKALEHPYFTNYPPPTHPRDLPRPTPRESAPLQQSTLPTISIAHPHNMPDANEGAENLSPSPHPAKKRTSLPSGGHGSALGYISPNTPGLSNMATDE